MYIQHQVQGSSLSHMHDEAAARQLVFQAGLTGAADADVAHIAMAFHFEIGLGAEALPGVCCLAVVLMSFTSKPCCRLTCIKGAARETGCCACSRYHLVQNMSMRPISR